MAQTLGIDASNNLASSGTLTATRRPVGSYTTEAATSVAQQSGTCEYLVVFPTNASGNYRVDLLLDGSPIGVWGDYVLDGTASTFWPAGYRPSVLTTSDIPTAAAIADAVWDEATSGHATAGTTGAAIMTASNAVTVVPVVGSVQNRVDGTSIVLFTSELSTVSVGVVDANGVAVDLTGLALELIFESGATEVVIADADITKTTSSFSFTATTALTTAERRWRWALRKTSDESVLLTGTLEVVYAANN